MTVLNTFGNPQETDNLSSTDYFQINSSIKETFESISLFECHLAHELRTIRDNKLYRHGNYKSFEEYCESELNAWGGYRRVNQLITAAQVMEVLEGTEYEGAITKERHARPLLRLVKSPEKLQEAVGKALANNPTPTYQDFQRAADAVEPRKRTTSSTGVGSVRVSSQSHPRYGEEGVIVGEPNQWQKIIEFPDGEREAIHNKDLDASSCDFSPKPRTYNQEQLEEAIAQIKQQHQKDLERLEADITSKIASQVQQQALAQAREELEAAREVTEIYKARNQALQQQIIELEQLRTLEAENQQLKERVEHLERSLQKQSQESWSGGTFTKEAAKIINRELQTAIDNLEPELHLRVLAAASPKTKRLEACQLLRLAMENLLESAIAAYREVLQRGAEATWNEFLEIAKLYEPIKGDIWNKLSPQERSQIKQLKEQSEVKPWTSATNWMFQGSVAKYVPMEHLHFVLWRDSISLLEPQDVEDFDSPQQWLEATHLKTNALVALADEYTVAYKYHGIVTEIYPDSLEVLVRWRERRGQPNECERYSVQELRIL